MVWKNHSATGWHIDHIEPVFLFDLSKKEEQEECFHFSNLRPMWADENNSRSKTKEYLYEPLIFIDGIVPISQC